MRALHHARGQAPSVASGFGAQPNCRRHVASAPRRIALPLLVVQPAHRARTGRPSPAAGQSASSAPTSSWHGRVACGELIEG
jgi:hypothetical protein